MGVFDRAGTSQSSWPPLEPEEPVLSCRLLFPSSFGVVGWLTGGVGGMSPVIWTISSTSPQSIFSATTGAIVKMSISSRSSTELDSSPQTWSVSAGMDFIPGSCEGRGAAGRVGPGDPQAGWPVPPT